VPAFLKAAKFMYSGVSVKTGASTEAARENRRLLIGFPNAHGVSPVSRVTR